jgi:hypothetical protein
MKKTIYLFALAGLTLAACGDNNKGPTDGNVTPDGSGSGSNNFPAAPPLGPQIDRMGRPAISTALNHSFEPPSAGQGSAKDAYNQDDNVAMWQQTWVPKFAPNLAIIDAADTGICGNGLCESTLPGIETAVTCAADCGGASPVVTKDGCGNVPLWTPNGSGQATPTSYVQLAGLLADDELYLDTSKTTCDAYLSLEFSLVTMIPVSSCGGRAPSYDVMDYNYSVLALGLAGFDPTNGLAPVFHDDPASCHTGGASMTDPACANHAPVGTSDTTFPFLAAPH